MRAPGPRRVTLAGVITEGAARRAGVAVGADGACLIAFVLLGRRSHGLNGGGDWFVTVLWPFVVGWYAAALVTRLYTVAVHPWRRAAATAVLGVTIACVVRATATSRSTPVVFGVIAVIFVVAATVGWRMALRLARRVRVAR